MKQTAIQELIEDLDKIKKRLSKKDEVLTIQLIINSAKAKLELEKQQIIEAYNNCIKDRYNNALVDMGFKEKSEKCYNTGKEYYKEKYEKN